MIIAQLFAEVNNAGLWPLIIFVAACSTAALILNEIYFN
jgi:hypothetical protein